MILVTGGAGFLGSALVRALAARGERVRALDNFARPGSRYEIPEVRGVEPIIDTVTDSRAVFRACVDVDTVVHMAAINGTRNFYERPNAVLRVGIEGTLNVIKAVNEDERIKHLIVVSSSEVYQTPPVFPTPEDVPLVVPALDNPRYSYGGGKIASELLARWCVRPHCRVTVVRPHNVYGPAMGYDHVIPELVEQLRKAAAAGNGALTLQGTGAERRAFLFVRDFVSAIETLLEPPRTASGFEVFNIGSDTETSIRELAQRLIDLTGIDVPVRTSPNTAPVGATNRRLADCRRLKALGWHARVSLDAGLLETAEWYLHNPKPQ